jgi:hypothetical protein
MAYKFPPDHERPIRYRLDPARTEPEAWRPHPSRPPAPPSTPAPKSEERPKSRPSYAEIDVVEADMSHDSRVERDG